MATIIVMARLFAEDDKAMSGHLVVVEAYDIVRSGWRALAEAETDSSGIVKAEVELQQASHGSFLPSLRLIENGNSARVISSGPSVTSQGRRGPVLADFGEIEYLGDAGFPRRGSQGEEQDTIVGLSRKSGLPQTIIIRGIDRNPNVGLSITRGDTRIEDVLTERDTVTSGAIAGGTIARAELDPKVSAELNTMHTINLNNTAMLAEKDRTIIAREHELELKTTELQTALDRASAAENKFAEVQVTKAGTKADIQNVFTNIGTKIGTASSALKTSANPFKIGAIKIDLKGALEEDGQITLGGDRVDGSGVSVEMAPEGIQPTDTDVKVPDVTGLTQSAARRVLRSVGLKLKPASQSVDAGTAAHGQALRQTPAAGIDVPHGGDVLVVFATVNNN